MDVKKEVKDVRIIFDDGKFQCRPNPVEVHPGDTIKWHFDPKFPFGVFVKEFDTPLDKNFYCAQIGDGLIEAHVRHDAIEEKEYHYAVGTTDGRRFKSHDPEIIVRRPPGR